MMTLFLYITDLLNIAETPSNTYWVAIVYDLGNMVTGILIYKFWKHFTKKFKKL